MPLENALSVRKMLEKNYLFLEKNHFFLRKRKKLPFP
jgi:hypothetical protein